MKTPIRICLAVILASATPNLVAQPATLTGTALQPIRFNLPDFPIRLLHTGVLQGQVELVFEVRPDGLVSDWLITAYTHREFARATERAVSGWRFEPGDAIHTIDLSLRFETRGVVVLVRQLGTQSDLENRELVFRPCPPAELDRPPQPVRTVSPAYSHQMAERGGTGTVRVHYFIDQEGKVRVPFPEASAHPLLATLAISAVKQWQFEPPTCRGRPTIVRAEQVFRFQPTTARVGAVGAVPSG